MTQALKADNALNSALRLCMAKVDEKTGQASLPLWDTMQAILSALRGYGIPDSIDRLTHAEWDPLVITLFDRILGYINAERLFSQLDILSLDVLTSTGACTPFSLFALIQTGRRAW